MTKLIAMIAVFALMNLNSLGNFWFTYGIWPRSWGAFALFQVTGLLLYMAFTAVGKDMKESKS